MEKGMNHVGIVLSAIALTGVFLVMAGCIGDAGESSLNTPSVPLDQSPSFIQQGQGPAGNLTAAAAALGVTEDALRTALGEPGQGSRDLAAVAASLGISEEQLMGALGNTGNWPWNKTGSSPSPAFNGTPPDRTLSQGPPGETRFPG